MAKRTKGWSFTKTVILPFTQIEAVISMPSWANRTQAKQNAAAIEDKDEMIIPKLMLIGCCTFDGEPIEPDELDELPFHDFSHLIAEFMEWEAENEKTKNVLPTKK